MKVISSLNLWLNNIPVCVCVCIYIYIYIYNHSFFILSTIDGHLDCFLILAIVNNTAVNTKV